MFLIFLYFARTLSSKMDTRIEDSRILVMHRGIYVYIMLFATFPADVHPGLVQHLNQLPSHNAPRPSPVTVASSGSQPAATQLHTTLLTQPEPGNNLVPVSSSAGQQATYQQNTEPLLQPSPMISPILSSSGAHSASSHRVMPSHLTPTSLPASSSYAPPCSAAPNMPLNYSSAVYNKSSPQSNAAKDMLLHGYSYE